MAGKALIFSAPSGSGKSSIVQWLVQQLPQLQFSISATTRPPRGQEQHGKEYYFLSADEFQQGVAAGDFLEYEEVYEGRYYGTLRSHVEKVWAAGNTVVFDIDVYGGRTLKQALGPAALAVYVDVPDLKVLEQRLRHRSTDSEEEIARRLAKADQERQLRTEFDLVLMNDDLERARQQALRQVTAFLGE